MVARVLGLNGSQLNHSPRTLGAGGILERRGSQSIHHVTHVVVKSSRDSKVLRTTRPAERQG
eukprot:4751358-Amphidinium_carterae.1